MSTITEQCFLLLLTAARSTDFGVFEKFVARVRNMHSKPLGSRIGAPSSISVRWHIWVEFDVGSRLASRVFLVFSRFPPSIKTIISKFLQFDQSRGPTSNQTKADNACSLNRLICLFSKSCTSMILSSKSFLVNIINMIIASLMYAFCIIVLRYLSWFMRMHHSYAQICFWRYRWTPIKSNSVISNSRPVISSSKLFPLDLLFSHFLSVILSSRYFELFVVSSESSKYFQLYL